jgi:FtsP/CotA-like multicopper oxidase with cupredoxin domain
MFTILFILQHLGSILLLIPLGILLVKYRPTNPRQIPKALLNIVLYWSAICLAAGCIFYPLYHWSFSETWLAVAFTEWIVLFAWLVCLKLKRLDKTVAYWGRLLLFPVATMAAALGMEQPDANGVVVLALYALLGVGVIALYRRIGHLAATAKLLLRAGLVVFCLATVIILVQVQQRSSRLADVISMNMPNSAMNMSAKNTVDISQLVEPASNAPVDSFTLTASAQKITLSSGISVAAWTYGGTTPAPTLRVTQGHMVEVTLVNHLPDPTTIHWHGIDLPNAEDGVSGITQDAVLPGKSYTYRFLAKDAGTYWYHSHQDANDQVQKGLYGMIIVEPAQPTSAEQEVPIAVHTWPTAQGNRLTLNTSDDLEKQTIKPGTVVRLRVTNTDNGTHHLQIVGVPFEVAALDGRDIHSPTTISNQQLALSAGGRADIVFTMPDRPVQFMTSESGTSQGALLMSPSGTGSRMTLTASAKNIDMMSYGKSVAGALTIHTHFDKAYTVNLDQRFGFFDESFSELQMVNNALLPHAKMLMVHTGDVVKITIHNRSLVGHPIHLHGHHFTVLSHNGVAYTGSPLQLDSLQTEPGDTWEIAFTADNPGLWMAHCHNLAHAARGMDLMVGYDNVMTSYTFGHASKNKPE